MCVRSTGLTKETSVGFKWSFNLNGAKFLDQLSEKRNLFHVRAFNLSSFCLFVETEFCPTVAVYKYQQKRIKIYRVIRLYSLLSLVYIYVYILVYASHFDIKFSGFIVGILFTVILKDKLRPNFLTRSAVESNFSRDWRGESIS